MSRAHNSIQSIAVIGAGIIGLSCALELADRGLTVSLFEPNWPPRGASWAAAGMLAPAFEAASTPGTHPRLYDICDAGARLWGDWSKRLEDRSGLPSGYMPGPSLAVARSQSEADRLNAVYARLREQRASPEPCLQRLHDIEPAIETTLLDAMLLPSDGQADNRRTLEALIACISGHPNITVHANKADLQLNGFALDHAGYDATLIASGWQSAKVTVRRGDRSISIGDIVPAFDTLQAFGGQMLAVAPVSGGPKMTVRCGDLYIVPKSDRIIIGATTEPGRELKRPDADVIDTLRRRAVELCPALETAAVIESWAGVRPGTPDHAPILGETSLSNLFVATGHFRNGILLAPISAEIMADLIVDGRSSDLASAFAPIVRNVEQV